MLKLLTSSDQSSTYSLVKSAVNQGLICRRIAGGAAAWQPEMETPQLFLNRERLNAYLEITIQCDRSQSCDMGKALRAIDSGFAAFEGGVAPSLAERPSWLMRLLGTKQAYEEAVARYIASIVIRSSAEDFRTVVVAHSAAQALLRSQ